MKSRLRLRRAALGLAAGLLASPPLTAALGNPALAVLLGVLGGIAYALVYHPDPEPGAFLDGAFTTAALRRASLGRSQRVSPCPQLAGRGPQWTAEGMRVLFPALVGWLLFRDDSGVARAAGPDRRAAFSSAQSLNLPRQ